MIMMIIQNIIALFIFSSIDCRIYVYNTDDSRSVDYYDCIYHDTMFYCRRPNESILLQRGKQPWNCLNDGIRHSFQSLLMNNVSVSTILHEWKSGVDKAEEYLHYLTKLLNSTDEEKYLCQCNSPKSFGQHCEYLLHTGETFADAADETLSSKQVKQKVEGEIVCYKTLECDYGLLCLDWRDICNGIQNCMFGYDEENCDKIEFNECEDDEYRCMNGMCIPDQYFLDGEYDCMDLSDEKEQLGELSCSSQLASFDCDDRICPLRYWSCGDGQCIKDRLSFQKSGSKVRPPTCSNRRDRLFFCETNNPEKLWTLPNGQCATVENYTEADTTNRTLEDYCIYLLRCSLSHGVEKNCPRRENFTYNELLRDNCSALIPIQYPKGALLAPYLYHYYDIKFKPLLSYEQLDLVYGTIKCRGYMWSSTGSIMLRQKEAVSLEFLEPYICLFTGKRDDLSNGSSHQFCHNDSRTFNNRSYHFIDVCNASRECISAYRINDGIPNCKTDSDDEDNTELVTNSCANVHRHRFRCSIDQSTCLYANSFGDGHFHCTNYYDKFWKGTHISLSEIICNNQDRDGCQPLRDYIEASWKPITEQNSTLERSPSKHIPFRSYCDTFWDLSSNQDENLTSCKAFWKCPKDKWQCFSGPCLDVDWLLDDVWDCPDASDEVNMFAFRLNNSDHNNKWTQNPGYQSDFETNYKNLPFAKMCNSSTEYPCLPINMSDYSNNNRFCIDLKLIGDGRIDCMGGHDERSTISHCNESSILGYHYKCLSTNTCIPYSLLCTPEHRCPHRADDELWCKHYEGDLQSEEFICDNGTIIINSTCNNKIDCSNGEDEYMCHHGQSLDNSYRKQRQLASRIEQQQQQELRLPKFPANKSAPSTIDPKTSTIIINPNITEPPIIIIIPEPSIFIRNPEIPEPPPIVIEPVNPPDPIDDPYIPNWCNRGIGVLTSNGSNICFCPPQYHGDQCQYHSDRIALYFHLNFSQSTYTSSTSKNLLIKLVILFLNEDQVLHTQEIHIRPASEIDTYKKRRLHFLYSRSLQALKAKQQRYANRSNIITEHPYSFRIEAYELKIDEKPRRFAVWKYPIYFDYLPVHRLVKVLRLTESRPCQNNPCNQNQECYELVNQTSQYICLCKPNYSGPNCEYAHPMCQNNYCSSKALCQPLYRSLSNGHEYPYCICPFNHNGQRCELVRSACLENPCQNGGTCSQRTRANEFSCECPTEYEGEKCEKKKEIIYLPITKNSTITHDAVVVQYFKINLKTLELKLSNQSVHFNLPDLLFYRYSEKSAPEITLLKIYMNSSEDAEIYLLSLHTNNATTFVTEENRCHHVDNLFPDHSVFKYHYYCYTNQSLLCFRDDAYLCICEKDHERAECFNYNYELDHCSKCLANGRCLKGMKDEEYLCLCPPCHLGRFCQFNFQSFSFTLDQLFFHDLLSSNSLTRRITYYVLIIIPSLLFLFGLINNLCCFSTFRRSKCLQNGIGQYLFCTTIINQMNLAFLLIRFVHLTVNISHTYSTPLVNTIMCKVSSYLLVSTTRIIYWFSSLIAIERLYVTFFLNGKWLKKPNTARLLILIIILSALVTTAYELAFIQSQVGSDDGDSSMCVLNFPDSYSFWKTWHIVITVINASIPFLINLSCTIAIICAIARKKIKLNQRDTGSIKEIKASPLKITNKFRLFIHLLIENKESLVAPAFTLIPQIFSLPFFIASFSLGCQNLHENHLQYLLIVSYMTTFIPQLTSFFLYISPSSFYSQEWRATKISKQFLSLKQRLRISNPFLPNVK